ncbi:MAG: hypothetical protein H7240_07700 [Glaciimonas sp.]|nr:hypothetical protein [Glaciimonas sp.]
MLIVSTSPLMLSNADARRLGGGGCARSIPSRPMPQSPNANQARPAAPAAATGIPAKPASLWRGILGGASLLGLDLGTLMSNFGLGGAPAYF